MSVLLFFCFSVVVKRLFWSLLLIPVIRVFIFIRYPINLASTLSKLHCVVTPMGGDKCIWLWVSLWIIHSWFVESIKSYDTLLKFPCLLIYYETMDLSVYASCFPIEHKQHIFCHLCWKKLWLMSCNIRESESFLHIISLFFIVNKINSVLPQNNDLFSEGSVYFQLIQLMKLFFTALTLKLLACLVV